MWLIVPDAWVPVPTSSRLVPRGRRKGAFTNADEIRKIFKENFQMTAAWRARKAREYPDDARNGRAERLLTELAADTASISDESAEAYDAAFESADEGVELIEIEQPALKRVGFSSVPSSAQQFVDDIVSELNESRS